MPCIKVLLYNEISIRSRKSCAMKIREQRRSSARLLNLHIAIYNTRQRASFNHDSIVPPPTSPRRRRTISWHSARASAKAYRRKNRRAPGRELPSRSRILNVLSVARVSESRRARDNNFRTVSAVNLASELVPHLHMRQFLLWAKSVRDWQPISDLTGVTKRECTRSYAHTYERAPISIRAHTSPMPARFLQPPFFISISPPNARHGVAFRWRDWRRAGTTGDFQYVLTSRNNFS